MFFLLSCSCFSSQTSMPVPVSVLSVCLSVSQFLSLYVTLLYCRSAFYVLFSHYKDFASVTKWTCLCVFVPFACLPVSLFCCLVVSGTVSSSHQQDPFLLSKGICLHVSYVCPSISISSRCTLFSLLGFCIISPQHCLIFACQLVNEYIRASVLSVSVYLFYIIFLLDVNFFAFLPFRRYLEFSYQEPN